MPKGATVAIVALLATVGVGGAIALASKKAGGSSFAADINATSISVQQNGSTTLSAKVSGGVAPYSYDWQYNGASIGNAVQISPTFPAVGQAQVTLTVTDATGATSKKNITITVVAPLAATVTANPQTGPSPLTVVYSSSVSGGLGPYTYEWKDSTGNLLGTGSSYTVTYASPGDYDVSLTVTDSA